MALHPVMALHPDGLASYCRLDGANDKLQAINTVYVKKLYHAKVRLLTLLHFMPLR